CDAWDGTHRGCFFASQLKQSSRARGHARQHARRGRSPDSVTTVGRDFYGIEAAKTTALTSAALSEKMADVDSASCCIFSQTHRDGPRGATWSHSSISRRKTLRGMRRFRDYRRGSCDHSGPSLFSVGAPKNGVFPKPP